MTRARSITNCAAWGAVIEVPPAGGYLPAAILGLSPLSYFDLRETSGTNANDQGSLANDGTYSLNVALASKVGADGFSYPVTDTGDNGIAVPDNDAYTPGTAGGLTVGFLFYLDNLTGDTSFIAKFGAGSSAREWRIEAVSDGRLYIETLDSGGGTARRRITSVGFVTTGGWHMVIGRWSGIATAHPTLRYDGASVSGTGSGSDSAQGNTGAGVSIMFRGASAPIRGSMAHVFIYAGQLSDGNCAVLEAAAAADGW